MGKANLWLEVQVWAHRLDAEAVAAALEMHSSGGVALEEPLVYPAGDDGYRVDLTAPVLVKAYLPQGAAQRWPALRRRLRRLPLAGPLRTRSRWLAEEDWANAWKEFFPVLRVGRRLVVRPTWRDYAPQDDDLVIHLDPGLAFGTGQHPTTRLCLQALEELVTPGMRVLDLGAGSGILAIAAAKLGARRVLALDIDPQAVRVARENVAINWVNGVAQVEEGSLSASGAWPPPLAGRSADFDLAMANISASVICALAPQLARVLGPRAIALVSGFTSQGAAAVSQRLAEVDFAVERTMAEGDWRAIVARKG